MHIQSYQINNILNAYRKQLSQRTSSSDQLTNKPPMITNRYKPILDKVSIDVMTRMTDSRTEKSLTMNLDRTRPVARNMNQGDVWEETCFTYTLIDENNNKSANSLAPANFHPFVSINATYETLAPKSTL